jgi:hypothetical protein
MKRWRWHRPSPALLIACVALFVALGGTVLAATKIDGHTIRVKSLPGNRLAVRSVPGNRLQPGTIPGSRLAPGSVKADQIDVGSLGPVPSAVHADSADTAHRAQTAIAADQAADATTINGRAVGCREGTREFAGACWDLNPSSSAVTAPQAAAACADRGGELPQGLTLAAFITEPGLQLATTGEWLNEVWVNSGTVYSVDYLKPDGNYDLKTPDQQLAFRCVTPLLS